MSLPLAQDTIAPAKRVKLSLGTRAERFFFKFLIAVNLCALVVAGRCRQLHRVRPNIEAQQKLEFRTSKRS